VCLSLFPWAKYRKKKGAFKLHTLLDHTGYLPSFLVISEGKTHDINIVKDDEYGFQELSPDSILLIGRAYIYFKWLYSLTLNKLFFVTKAKRNMNYKVIGQQDVPKNKGVISDHHIRLTGLYKQKDYPDQLRLVTYIDRETGEEHVFLTNNFKLSSQTIANLYESRWEVETFFKLSFIKFQTKYRHSLHELTRIVGELFLDNIYLIETLIITFDKYKLVKRKQVQLYLF